MPPAAGQDLEQEGFLYVEQRYTGRQYNISTRMDRSHSTRSPFHLKCTVPVSDSTVAYANWRISPCMRLGV